MGNDGDRVAGLTIVTYSRLALMVFFVGAIAGDPKVRAWVDPFEPFMGTPCERPENVGTHVYCGSLL
jgi:hypothetical protein